MMKLMVGYDHPIDATIQSINIYTTFDDDFFRASFAQSPNPHLTGATNYQLNITHLTNKAGETIDVDYFDTDEFTNSVKRIELVVDDLGKVNEILKHSWGIPVSWAVFNTVIINKKVNFI